MARMYVLMAALFGVVYALIAIAGSFLGVGSFLVYGGLAAGIMLFQYLIGPKIVEWSMKVEYVPPEKEPGLHSIVKELADKAGIPKPRVGISHTAIPNAFAFGRTRKDSRICVTDGMLQLLSKEELRAVLGHEISHVKHRDVLVITAISVIPTIAWYMAWSMMFSRENENGAAAIGMVAFLIYFLTNLLVLYASRIREYYADRGAVSLGEKPHDLASALYKLTYGSAMIPKRELKKVEGMKAFFASDPSRAAAELSELKALDSDLSGSIDKAELASIRGREVRLSGGDKLMEMFSTHPNMLKRISALSSYSEPSPGKRI